MRNTARRHCPKIRDGVSRTISNLLSLVAQTRIELVPLAAMASTLPLSYRAYGTRGSAGGIGTLLQSSFRDPFDSMLLVKRTLAKANHFAQDVLLSAPRDAHTTAHPCLLRFGRRLAPSDVNLFHEGHYGQNGRAEQVLNVTLFSVE